jgi:biotin carboxylase
MSWTGGGAMAEAIERILCISSYEKGQDFLRQCADMGVRPTLLTLEKHRDGDWPRECLEDLAVMPANLTREQILNTVCWMARERRFDRVVALDEFDQETAAAIREHWRLPGMNLSTTAFYRDKLAMRTGARKAGFLVPEFCRVLNYDDLRGYMGSVPGPWLLKPRAEASALGIRKIQEPEQLWRNLEELGDRQSHFLMERFVPGDIFHVDSIVSNGKVVFSVVHQYGRPPMQVMHEGGVFTTRTVDRDKPESKALTELNSRLAPALGMFHGVTHGEYIRAHGDGRFYFLEIAARVGGAFIADLVQASTGINLWREWARLEVDHMLGLPYTPPPNYEEYAGSVLCLAQTAEPDTSSFDAPEIVYRMKKHHHAGLIVRSPRAERVKELLEDYGDQFARLYLATMPAPEKPTA